MTKKGILCALADTKECSEITDTPIKEPIDEVLASHRDDFFLKFGIMIIVIIVVSESNFEDCSFIHIDGAALGVLALK